MKVAIGADHRGFIYKEYIKETLKTVTFIDVGAFSDERSDYPLFAHKVIALLVDQKVSSGILLCGSGVGMAMAANRYRGIYSGVAWSVAVARACKEDDNVNIVVIPVDYVSKEESVAIITAWHDASFKGGRYAERLALIDK